MVEFFTENSVYVIDDDEHRYMRIARENPVCEIRNLDGSWRLEDGEWLPLRDWRMENTFGDGYRLRIFTPDAVHGVVTSLLMSKGEAEGTEAKGVV